MFGKLTLFTLCCLVILSCSSKKEVEIDFSSDRTTIVFKNLDEVSLYRSKQQLDSLSSDLVNVFEMDEASGMEKQVAGKLVSKGEILIFVPQQPFVKGREYEVQTLLNSSFGKSEDLLKADMGKTVKRQTKLLVR